MPKSTLFPSTTLFRSFGRPLRGIFAAQADLTPYKALQPAVDINDRKPTRLSAGQDHAQLDFAYADAIDDEVLNRILWKAIKGDAPYSVSRGYANPFGR